MFAMMATEPIITNEGVNYISILLTQIECMAIELLINKHFPTYGNWQDNFQKVKRQ